VTDHWSSLVPPMMDAWKQLPPRCCPESLTGWVITGGFHKSEIGKRCVLRTIGRTRDSGEIACSVSAEEDLAKPKILLGTRSIVVPFKDLRRIR
jgi:hypothetical protein